MRVDTFILRRVKDIRATKQDRSVTASDHHSGIDENTMNLYRWLATMPENFHTVNTFGRMGHYAMFGRNPNEAHAELACS